MKWGGQFNNRDDTHRAAPWRINQLTGDTHHAPETVNRKDFNTGSVGLKPNPQSLVRM